MTIQMETLMSKSQMILYLPESMKKRFQDAYQWEQEQSTDSGALLSLVIAYTKRIEKLIPKEKS